MRAEPESIRTNSAKAEVLLGRVLELRQALAAAQREVQERRLLYAAAQQSNLARPLSRAEQRLRTAESRARRLAIKAQVFQATQTPS